MVGTKKQSGRLEIITGGLSKAILDIEDYFAKNMINISEQELILQHVASRVKFKTDKARAENVLDGIPGMNLARKFLTKHQEDFGGGDAA